MPISNSTKRALLEGLAVGLVRKAADKVLEPGSFTIALGSSGLTVGITLDSGQIVGIEKFSVDSGSVSGRLYVDFSNPTSQSGAPLSMTILGIFTISLEDFSVTVEHNLIKEWVFSGTLGFPAFWNHDKVGSTAEIRATDMHFGAGGVSGTLTLEAITANHPSPLVKIKFGDSFSISLDAFSVTLKQNAIAVGSKIEGTLVIPGFKDANNQPAEIRIEVDIHQNGDFDVTAYEDDGFKAITFGDVFSITLKSVFLGKKDDDFYIGVSGSITFISELLSGLAPVEVEKLLIWSDGRFEIEGGTIPLPKNLRFPIGPAELSISAIHLGSHQRVESDGSITNFRYFGFDGGIDVNPGGVDVRGKGIKFYFPVNGPPSLCYLEIKSIAIDLVIPGTASKESATALISGFLSIGSTSSGEPEYEGGVTFSLPKAKIVGGASMKYRPKTPAFIVDAFVDLSTPIPLGATGLGVYGFRGLFGLRYIATKHAADLQETNTWFDYYKAKTPPEEMEGVNISKFETPDDVPDVTGDYDNAFSIGAGVTLGTTSDSGNTFSCKLFLLLSLPDLIYLEGKANILGERVGLTGEDPPFFAFLAISSQSVETGFGVNYQLPKKDNSKGWILDLNAEMRAAFFFQNSSAWYVNFGTVQNPIAARVLTLFDASAYVMLSAAGISAGASVTFGFDKSYAGGLVQASVGVYIIVGGFISSERPQIGGFAMLGGHVDVSLMWVGFHLSIDTSLSVEVPKPFYIQGEVHLCVGVSIGFWKCKKKIEKCFDVEFKWEKNSEVDTSFVLPFKNVGSNSEDLPLSATNMLSGESFKIAFYGTTMPSAPPFSFSKAVLPLDSWVDLEFLKGLAPAAGVDARIGRLSGQAPTNNIDLVPPVDVPHQVKHEYAIKMVEIKAWSGSTWVDYRPYQAMSPPAALTALGADPLAYKDGFWQNSGAGFNKLRLLSETSFSYMQQGQPGWYVPEQFGITSATLFCRTKIRDKHCLRWTDVAPGTVYPANTWQQYDTVLFHVSEGAGSVIDWNSHFDIPRSFAFANESTCQVLLNKPSVEVDLKLTTFSSGIVLRFYKRKTADVGLVYELVETRTLTPVQLLAKVQYNNPAEPVVKVEIDPINVDSAAVYALDVQIAALYRQLYEKTTRLPVEKLDALILKLEEERARLMEHGCPQSGMTRDTLAQELLVLQHQVSDCREQLATLNGMRDTACKEANDFRARFERCFPFAPSVFSYEILEESRSDGTLLFRFRVYNDQTNTVLLNSVQSYPDAATAEKSLSDVLDLALRPGAYAVSIEQNSEYSFRIVGPSSGSSAVSPMRFGTAKQLTAFTEQIRERLREVRVDETVALARRVEGMLPHGQGFDCPDCWSDLSELIDVNGTTSTQLAECCRNYNAMYRELYTRAKQLLDQKVHHCKDLTHEGERKAAECQNLSDRITAVQLLIGTFEKGTEMHPPEGISCSTLLHEVCCRSLEDYLFNLSVPPQDAIEKDYQSAVQAIERMLTPIWRPDTTYCIRLEMADTVNNSGQHSRSFYFGFRTAGPVGHFHNDDLVEYVDREHGKTPDQYMLTGLKGYLDYRRSYPNADGELIRAKPLFYEDARILLFFTKRYTYHFFGDWPAYNGLSAISGAAMQIIIKDPAEDTSIPNPPLPLTTTTKIPQAVVTWQKDDDPRIPEDIRTLQILRNPELLNPDFEGGDCWLSGGDMITPASVYTKVTPQYLKPLKLYTVVVNNVYKEQIQEVHRYVFQTSRYPDFTAQVKSYQLDDGEGNQRAALFRIDVSLSAADTNLLYDIVTGVMSAPNVALAGIWADPFDRLVEGAMKLAPLDAAISTEFNVVRNATSHAVVGVWIRNPEPFNDPKLPDDVLLRSLRVMNGLAPDLNYKVLFSKDRSQAFVMHPSKAIPVTTMKFRFAYIEWNGTAYVDRTVVITGAINMNF